MTNREEIYYMDGVKKASVKDAQCSVCGETGQLYHLDTKYFEHINDSVLKRVRACTCLSCGNITELFDIFELRHIHTNYQESINESTELTAEDKFRLSNGFTSEQMEHISSLLTKY